MDDALQPTPVWDLPTRVFHWLLATCVVVSVATAKIGGNAMVWHFRFGYVIFTLLLFRLVWGLVGGHWSRFTSFVYAPAATLRYLRGASRPDEHHEVGHSPVGALSVFGLLAVLIAQVGSGLFADDEISNTGPLIKFVSGATSSLLTGWHKGWGQYLVIGLALLHVLAIAYYVYRRHNDLVAPMWHGDKPLPAGVPATIDRPGSRALAAMLAAACAGVVTWLVNLGS